MMTVTWQRSNLPSTPITPGKVGKGSPIFRTNNVNCRQQPNARFQFRLA
jgi:hypothetical protein